MYISWNIFEWQRGSKSIQWSELNLIHFELQYIYIYIIVQLIVQDVADYKSFSMFQQRIRPVLYERTFGRGWRAANWSPHMLILLTTGGPKKTLCALVSWLEVLAHDISVLSSITSGPASLASGSTHELWTKVLPQWLSGKPIWPTIRTRQLFQVLHGCEGWQSQIEDRIAGFLDCKCVCLNIQSPKKRDATLPRYREIMS